ncbi:trypsin-like peptidase domain-containing protein [Micromonospora sp. WMMA1363]|uniref:S1C family serine protease n=1 Tax=Micromonospora sp. WMMA1363 TaxID=3053985 RepID=UPI00259C6CF2|nr:trypsin-like peptidase domain-containing protein [Micromonospora sp. WMMA1363]MDM4720573.1 trypsin-like peptidase domain-containing protein [Micromonospora sp. WMMA1363]
MTEYESDPLRRPAPTDAEPSQPTAELPRDERAQSDSAPITPGVPASAPDAAPGGTHPAAAPDGTGPDAARTPEVPAVVDSPVGPGPAATDGPGGVETPPPVPAYPVVGAAPSAGYPYAASGWQQGRHPGVPWYTGQQQPGWRGGQSGGYHPGQPHHLTGQPVPPWAAPQASPPGPGPGRVVKFVGAGVAVLALMFGSGVAGGALALALGGDSGITRTYSAAPVINSADLPRIAASVQPSVVSIATDNGEGSGVILSDDGFVLTNNHVIASASGDTVRVIFADGETAQARIVGTDPKTDLAVVRASGVSDLKPATFGDSDAMQVGDQVLALGSPLGLQGSVTAGILSARDRTIQAGGSQQDPRQGVTSIAGLLQTDAPINPGNSGGALVNTRGEVIGINTAIATAGQGSTGNIGVGFAIPSNKAKDVAGKLQRGEKVSHPTLGVSVNRAEGGGALVAAVTPGSAAERAGLQRGDVIVRFGDKVINDSDDLVAAVQAGKVGDRVELTYKRNGAESTATVTLAEAS